MSVFTLVPIMEKLQLKDGRVIEICEKVVIYDDRQSPQALLHVDNISETDDDGAYRLLSRGETVKVRISLKVEE